MPANPPTSHTAQNAPAFSGIAVASSLAILAWITWRIIESPWLSGVLLAAGLLFAAAYLAVKPWRHRLLGWFETLTFPIRWVATVIALGIVYYLVLLPIAIWYRLSGRSMQAQQHDATTNWDECVISNDPDSYFKAF